jgi:hypothetical protein
MVSKTAEQIWNEADIKHNTILGMKRAINREFRNQDDSHLWPIKGRFNVTERAIRAARKYERESGCAMDGLEYASFLEAECSRIVNDPKNQ